VVLAIVLLGNSGATFNDRLSFMVESAYVMTRPAFEPRANGRMTTTRLNADALVVRMGFAHGLF
jgi:hypothetical protein